MVQAMVMELVSWCIMLYSQVIYKFIHTYDLMEVLLKVTHRYWRKWQVVERRLPQRNWGVPQPRTGPSMGRWWATDKDGHPLNALVGRSTSCWESHHIPNISTMQYYGEICRQLLEKSASTLNDGKPAICQNLFVRKTDKWTHHV